MPISSYSTTASSNNSAPPNGAPEGMSPAAVNDVIRQVMADVRLWYEAAQWIDLGHTPTRTGATTFTVATDLTATYTVGRRIRCTDSTTLYGTITASSYSAPNTTVTVTLDSGSLSASLSAVAVGILTTASPSIPILYRQSADVASASTINLDSVYGDLIDVTGTTTITAVTLAQGQNRVVRFTGALTLTNGASLVLPGGANITTAAGDFAIFRGYASGVVRCVSYQRASGRPVLAGVGDIIQSVTATYTSNSDITTQIPTDDTIPQNTEGVEIVTVAITPTSDSSNLRIRVQGFGAVSGTGTVVTALFRDSTADALCAQAAGASGASTAVPIALEHVVAAGSTSSTTFKVRVGPNTGITLRCNGNTSGRWFGGVAAVRITVEEVQG